MGGYIPKITAIFSIALLASCSSEKPATIMIGGHDSFGVCFKPDNKTNFMIDSGYGCHEGDHSARSCYLADGTVVGVQRHDDKTLCRYDLAARAAATDERHSQMSCFKPDNATYFNVQSDYGCHPGDHPAYPCYLRDRTVIGVQKGKHGEDAECAALGGTLYGWRAE